MNQLLRVLFDFVSMPDPLLDEFTDAVITGLTGNLVCPTPPVSPADLRIQLTAFSEAMVAHAQGGPTATAAKNAARAVLVDSLRQNALYVQTKCSSDLPALLATGYHAASTNHAQTPLEQPVIGDLINGNSGELVARLKPVANARAYEARYAVIGAGGTPGPWQNGGLFTSTRNLTITGLTPGATYIAEVRAIGGSTGYSDWSNAVSHMSL